MTMPIAIIAIRGGIAEIVAAIGTDIDIIDFDSLNIEEYDNAQVFGDHVEDHLMVVNQALAYCPLHHNLRSLRDHLETLVETGKEN